MNTPDHERKLHLDRIEKPDLHRLSINITRSLEETVSGFMVGKVEEVMPIALTKELLAA